MARRMHIHLNMYLHMWNGGLMEAHGEAYAYTPNMYLHMRRGERRSGADATGGCETASSTLCTASEAYGVLACSLAGWVAS